MSFVKVLLVTLCLVNFARAEDPPFAGAAADYGGIIEDATGTAPDNSGIVTVGVLESGSFSAKVVWQGQTYTFKGKLDAATGEYTKSDLAKKVPVTPDTDLTVTLKLTIDTLTIDGTITDPDGGGSPVSANFQLSGQPPDPVVTAQLDPGLRMAFIDPTVVDEGSTAAPENGTTATTEVTEDGFAVITVGRTARRSSRFVGRLPDTQKYSAGAPLRGSQYALRSGLYPQRRLGPGGQLLGNANASSSSAALSDSGRSPQAIGSAASLIAALRWHKKAGVANTNAYPNGIRQRVDLDTIPYTPSRNFSFMLTGQANSGANATLRMSRGNLAAPTHDPISVKMNVTIFGARIIGPNPYGIKVSVNPRAAKFTGSFKHPDTTERIKFSGSFRSFFGIVPGEGRGNFLSVPSRDDPTQSRSGSVRITVD